jgi:hypothetical protein
MRDKKRVVLPAPSGDNKPVAPPDMWCQMDELVSAATTKTVPDNHFTFHEFIAKYGYGREKGYRLLRSLRAQGKVKRVGTTIDTYYVVVPNANL